MRLFPVVAHTANLIIRHSPRYITTAIGGGFLSQIKILIPPIELQTQFANIVTKTEALKEHYKNSLQELENLYGSLSQQAFKGELEFRTTAISPGKVDLNANNEK
jgi:type I restriction enzyme S subunit